jgi:sec-independent protein translocase protein TatC
MVIYALAAIGFLKAKQLAQQWKIAIVVITIIAAVITPTVDPVNQALVMAPMIALYGLSIVGARVAEGARNRSLQRRTTG